MFRGRHEMKKAYEDEAVASAYVDVRFSQPMGALLHSKQRRVLLRLIDDERPGRLLELAPGPARLTIEVARAVPHGTAIDASAQMLQVAKRRLQTDGREWYLVQGDAFNLPVQGPFDLVYTFRFLRHFDAPDRRRLYAEIARVLRPGGLLVFDAVNRTVSAPLRATEPQEYRHYDALFTAKELRAELLESGLPVVALDGVQHRQHVLSQLQVLLAPRSRAVAAIALAAVNRFGGGEPLEWIVTCRRA